jgi:3-dehydroquinate synthase
VTALVKRARLPTEIPPQISMQSLIQAMEIDKKVAGGRVRFVMCEGIGKTRFHWIAPDEIVQALGG